jgi:hypothetical protein
MSRFVVFSYMLNRDIRYIKVDYLEGYNYETIYNKLGSLWSIKIKKKKTNFIETEYITEEIQHKIKLINKAFS